MALKALLLRKKIDDKKKALDELRSKAPDFATREAELEAAINEAASEEDRRAVEQLVGEFETERAAHEEQETALAQEIDQLEQELTEEEARSAKPPANPKSPERIADHGERKDVFTMNMNTRGFLGMDAARRDAFLAREEVKQFLQRVREMRQEKRSVTGAELTIPSVVLDLLRENISRYSKLIPYVNLRPVSGNARQTIMGTVPEAVWTEACAKLNELDVTFGQVEVDGFKVGGYIAICNATLEDSDLNLASELMDSLGQAIGYAVDKAIVYGTGVKMPMGVVTRLAQSEQPSDWGVNAPAWKDLSDSHIITITGKTGADLFKSIILAAGKAQSTYSRGEKVWIMNESTKASLVAEGLAFNSAAALVSGVDNKMPVTGGDIVTLDFIPDGDIVFGYFALYLLAQRATSSVASSEHARFIEDQTVFKGTARYDGMPVIGEAFAVMNISGADPTTSVPFAPDSANP